MVTNLTPKQRFEAKLLLVDNGCVEFQGAVTSTGYGFFWYGGQNQYAHRMAWFFAYGIMPNECVLHKCDNRLCVNIEHLFLGTYQDNTNDMLAKGRRPSSAGSQNSNTKLNEDLVRSIKIDLTNGESRRQIATKYGTTYDIVKAIDRGISWRHV